MTKKEWWDKRRERIHREVPIAKVLYDYGYYVRQDLDVHHEQQFPCDLHGDGLDGKPSARVYPATSSWYCWGCQQSRDAITTVQEKEGVTYGKACFLLETRYGLKPMSRDFDDDEPEHIEFGVSKQKATIKDAIKRIERVMLIHTRDRSFTMRETLGFWEALDFISWQHHRNLWSDDLVKRALQKLYNKIEAKL